jgi:peptide/nickel transport system permease protein
MYKYTAKRILLMVPTLIGAAILVFILLRLIPGDVCELRLAGSGTYVDPQAILDCQQRLGISEPKWKQFIDFMVGLATFNFGDSMWTGQPITYEIKLRFALSLQVAIMATIVSIAIAIPLGTISAVRQNTWLDYIVRAFSIAGIAMPSFWLGILIILGLLIFTQSWFGAPWMPPIQWVSPFEDPVGNFAQLIWPAMATGYRYSAVATRMMRSALLEVLREDYIRTARAKGLLEKVITQRHAWKNALLPVITVIGIEFAFLMGGLVVTEQVFNLNGLGKLFVESVTNLDYTMTQALVMLVATIFIIMNFLVDLCYAWLDPRIRYS